MSVVRFKRPCFSVQIWIHYIRESTYYITRLRMRLVENLAEHEMTKRRTNGSTKHGRISLYISLCSRYTLE